MVSYVRVGVWAVEKQRSLALHSEPSQHHQREVEGAFGYYIQVISSIMIPRRVGNDFCY